MAIDFPNSPSPGTNHTVDDKTWTFTDDKWALNVSAEGVQGPTGPTGSTGAGMPTGAVMPYAGTSAPADWLLCFGQEVSRTTYSTLFAVTGTAYGAGDGSTTFHLPDLRGRAIAGIDNMGGVDAGRLSTANTIGTTTGTETITLATADIPAHAHANTLANNAVNTNNQSADHAHAFSTGGISHNHTHSLNNLAGNDGGSGFGHGRYAGSQEFGINVSTGAVSQDHTHSGTTAGMSENHTHPVTSNVTISNVNAGGGGAHNNMQPTMVLNYIIKV